MSYIHATGQKMSLDLKVQKQYNYMNQAKDIQLCTRKEKLICISEAFKKLLDRVAVRMHSDRYANRQAKAHLTSVHNEQLLKKRKYSLVVGSQRKDTLIPSVSTEEAANRHLICDFSNNKPTVKTPSNKINKNGPRRTLKCRSDPAMTTNQSSQLYNRTFDYHYLLISKSCMFDDSSELKNTMRKSNRNRALFRTEPNSSQGYFQSPFAKNQESKIRSGQNKKKLMNLNKNQEYFQKVQANLCGLENRLEPWQTEVTQQYCFNGQ